MVPASKYNIVVRFGDFEGEQCYEAKVLELPDLAEYGDTYSEAYELAIDAIETTQDIFEKKGKKFPQPIASVNEDYSGRVTLRMPKSLHGRLASLAKEEATSLNQFLLSIISYEAGFKSSQILNNTMQVTVNLNQEDHLAYKQPTNSEDALLGMPNFTRASLIEDSLPIFGNTLALRNLGFNHAC